MIRFHEEPKGLPWGRDKKQRKVPIVMCTCRVLYISVPAGEHAHTQCPVHGDVVIRGSNIIC